MGDRKLDRMFRRYLRHGDVEALGVAFDLAAPELLKVARHLCRDEAEAEDAVQASFLTTLERARDYDPKRRLLPWMLGILANHARELYRGGARQPDPERLATERIVDPLEEAGQREFAGAVERSIEGLPEGYRDALRLHLLRGMGSGEIAGELGLEAGTARVRLHRGLEKLRQALPVGFVAGAAVVATPGRGLAAVRTEVLGAAGQLAGGSAIPAGSVATTSLLGGLLVSQRLVLGSVVAALFLLGGLWGWRELDRSPAAPPLEEPVALAAPAQDPVLEIASPGSPLEPEAPAKTRMAEPTGSAEVRFSGTVCGMDPSTTVLIGAEVWTRPAGAEERVLRDVTDPRGRFSFEAPPEEESTIFIEAEGYAPFRAPVSEHAFERYWYSHSREVRDGGAHISLGIIELWPGVELFGRASLEDGSAAVGAELFLLWDGMITEEFLPMEELAIGRSIEGGVLDFDGRVSTRSRAGEGNHLLVAVLGDRFGRTPFAALPGRDSVPDLEIVLREGRPLLVPVQDEAGGPIAAARVTVERDLGVPDWVWEVRRETRSRHPVPMPASIERFFVRSTDAEGIARFPALPTLDRDGSALPGGIRLAIHAEAAGFIPGCEEPFLKSGVYEAKALTLKTAGQLRLTGRVLDSEGDPCPRARVELLPSEVTVESGADGTWEIEPPPGTLVAELDRLVFRKGGFVEWSLSVSGKDPAATEIDVGDVRLGRPTTVSGRVVDDLGHPVSGVRVSITRDGGGPHDQPSLRTGEDGYFEHRGAPEGELELRVILIERARDFVQSREPRRIRGGDGGVLLVLERKPWNEGRVVAEIFDARTGAPLDALRAGVRYAQDGTGNILPSTQLAAGQVIVETVGVGQYQLWVHVANRPLGVIGFEIEKGESEVFLRIPVEEAGSIRGQLLGGGEVKLSSAFVKLELETSNGNLDPSLVHPDLYPTPGSRAPDEEGRFHWTGLTPGRWRVFVRSGEETAGPAWVEVHPGEESELELRLAPGACLLVEPGPGEPQLKDTWVVIVSTRIDGGPRENMVHIQRTRGGAPLGSDHGALRIVLPAGRIEYEIRLDDQESEPVARGVVELGQGEQHRISLAGGR